MATILCVSSAIPGSLYPSVELARRLERDGHDVTHASEEGARRTVSIQGLPFVPLEASRHDRFLETDGALGTWRRLRRLRSRRARAVESLAIGGFVDLVRSSRPDLVLIDGELHAHILAAMGCGARVALLNSFASIWRCPGLPPTSHRARPGVGWRGSRPGMWLLWQALFLRKRRRAVALKLRHVGADRISTLRALARQSGIDWRRTIDRRQWSKPFTYRHLPVLSLHARAFEFPHRPPARVRYVGPLILATRADPDMPRTERVALDTILERRRTESRTLVYAGFGSFLTAGDAMLRRLVDAVALRPDWDLVISLGGRVRPCALDSPPPNVHVFGWLPQVEVLRHADVAITHGGINTIDECVLAEVPMLVFCGYETDMAGNTSRVVHHGIGLEGDSARDRPTAIRDAIARLIDEPSFRSNLAPLRAAYVANTERRVAERAVEALLDGTFGMESASR